MKRFFGLFENVDDVVAQFDIAPSDLDGCEILSAEYEYEDYEGTAHVLFRKEGGLYEVVSGHCSCYGLEGTWKPERVVEQELRERAERYLSQDGQFSEYWRVVLSSI